MHTFKFSTHNTPQTGRMKLKVLRWTHHSGLVPPWDDLDNVIKGTSVMCLWYHCHLTTTVFFLLTNSRLRRQPCSLMVTRLWSGVPCTLYLVPIRVWWWPDCGLAKVWLCPLLPRLAWENFHHCQLHFFGRQQSTSLWYQYQFWFKSMSLWYQCQFWFKSMSLWYQYQFWFR